MNDTIALLQKNEASEDIISRAKTSYDVKSLQRESEVQRYLDSSKFVGKVGAFEGAGYASRGLYRSSINCIMFTRVNYFCPVCQEAMLKVISAY